jgi:hypothetical protein
LVAHLDPRAGYECRATPLDVTACPDPLELDEQYVYLLGIYLGDGTLAAARRNVGNSACSRTSDTRRLSKRLKGLSSTPSDGRQGVRRFSNASSQIRAMFAEACALVGVRCGPANDRNLTVARSEDVAFLDTFIGPKR